MKLERLERCADMIRAQYGQGKLMRAVLMKGGHLDGDASDDCLVMKSADTLWFRHERTVTQNTHGTGCTLSSAITANLANGMALSDAVGAAKHYVTEAIRHSVDIGHGHGPVNHFYKGQTT